MEIKVAGIIAIIKLRGGNMEVYEALQIVIKALEDSATCGRLGEKLRKAKITLYKYVTDKLVEDKEKKEISNVETS